MHDAVSSCGGELKVKITDGLRRRYRQARAEYRMHLASVSSRERADEKDKCLKRKKVNMIELLS